MRRRGEGTTYAVLGRRKSSFMMLRILLFRHTEQEVDTNGMDSFEMAGQAFRFARLKGAAGLGLGQGFLRSKIVGE